LLDTLYGACWVGIINQPFRFSLEDAQRSSEPAGSIRKALGPKEKQDEQSNDQDFPAAQIRWHADALLW
jgi:hypothetical protein